MSTKSAADAEHEQKIIDAQRQRCQAELQVAKVEAEAGDTDRAITHVQRIGEYVKGSRLSPTEKRAFTDQAMVIERTAHMKKVDLLLDRAIEQIRSGDQTGRNEALRIGKEHFQRAVQLGADDNFKAVVRKKIEIVMMTNAAGTSEKARQDKDGNNWRQQMAQDPEAVKRRHRRYQEPQLEVKIGDKSCYTINWSLGGMLVQGIDSTGLINGQMIPVALREREDDKSPWFRDTVEVVKFIDKEGGWALSFKKNDNAALAVTEKLRREKREPR